ncbi:hypothetical protein ACD589_27385 [Rhizobium sp. 814_E9_N1_1]|uniref:hypothetical protein n=1 Tax=unclassified Rhizobium TaxID=2613769 RepID=UPI003F20DCC3
MSHVIKLPLFRPVKGLPPVSNPDAEAPAALQSKRNDMVYVTNLLEGLRARLLTLSTNEKPIAAISSKGAFEYRSVGGLVRDN